MNKELRIYLCIIICLLTLTTWQQSNLNDDSKYGGYLPYGLYYRHYGKYEDPTKSIKTCYDSLGGLSVTQDEKLKFCLKYYE